MKVVYDFKRLKGFGIFELTSYPPSDISSDRIVIYLKVVMRQGRMALSFRPRATLKYLRLITVHFGERSSF